MKEKKNLQEMSIDELQEKNIIKKPEPKINGEAANREHQKTLEEELDSVIERTKQDVTNFQNASLDAEVNEEDKINFTPINPMDWEEQKKKNKQVVPEPRPSLETIDPNFKNKFAKLEEDVKKEAQAKLDAARKEHEEYLKNHSEESDKEELEETTIPKNEEVITKQDIKNEDEDIDDEEDEEPDEEEQKEELIDLQKSIKDKLKPINNIIDLNTFQVAKHPVSTSVALSKVDSAHKVDWMLYATGIPISFTDFKADEIERLDPRQSNENNLNALLSIYKLIYDHVVFRSAKKPEFEVWLKSIKYNDLDNLYFGIILASFGKKLTIPLNCSHCHKVYIKDIPTMDFVKYKNDAVKNRAEKLINTTSFEKPTYYVGRQQISDDIVVDLKEASLYDMIFVPEKLSEKFRTRYSRMLAAYPYIDNMYIINQEKHLLEPIDMSNFSDPMKNIRIRIKKFASLIERLNSDQYYLFNTYINKINEKYENKVKYGIPETVCSKCGKKNDGTTESAASLLFMRHRLMNVLAYPTE